MVKKKSPRPHAPSGVCAGDRPYRILNVLVACEESQAECLAFRNLGHNAFSCDIQKCKRSGHPEWHICGDVTPFLEGQTSGTLQNGEQFQVPQWDLIIAHPPCTYLCKLSSVQLHKNPDYHISFDGEIIEVNRERWNNMRKGRDFFLKCLQAKAPYLAVENPVPMRMAMLPPANAFACPSWFGVKYTKKTLYWLRNLPPIMAGVQYPNPKSYVNASRGKYRSRTFPQLAEAIASQWSDYILDDMKKNVIPTPDGQ